MNEIPLSALLEWLNILYIRVYRILEFIDIEKKNIIFKLYLYLARFYEQTIYELCSRII